MALLDPVAIIKLKETGECLVELPEMLFDLDYPGHYMRRIKSVSLTIPCVVGPYTGVSCTLTLLKNSVRKSSMASGEYQRDLENDDSRFVDNLAAIQSIATSSAQNDAGLFELNFRDERYLPFEGAGAISQWRIELSKDKELRQFDYNTISDVIIQMRYTARDGGTILKNKAIDELKTMLEEATLKLAENREGLYRMFSAKHEFPSQWHKFLHPTDKDDSQVLDLDLKPEQFPFPFRKKVIEVQAGSFFLLKLKDGVEYDDGDANRLGFNLLKKEGDAADELLAADLKFESTGSPVKDLPYAKALEQNESLEKEKWSIKVKRTTIPEWLRQKNKDGTFEVVTINSENRFRLNLDAIEDIWMVLQYSIKDKN